jgi:hypothetical protein
MTSDHHHVAFNPGLSSGFVSSMSMTSGASRSAEEEEDAPVVEPEYGDLLDARWLDRGTADLDPEDDLVDIGLTIDLDDGDTADEAAQVTELDVGTLLTSLPAQEEASDPTALDEAERAEREQAERSVGLGALQDLLLPDERGGRRREDDEAIGNDESFPVFDGLSAPRPPVPLDDDAEGPSDD